MHLAHTLYCCPVLSQFSPIPFYPLTVQNQDLENPKSVHLCPNIALTMNYFIPIRFYRLRVQLQALEHPKPVHFAHTIYCCPVLSQFSPITFYRLTVQYQDLENPKPVLLDHTYYSCLVNEPVHSNHNLTSHSTVTCSGKSQTSASFPHTYCCLVLSQFCPIPFYLLTVQYQDLENPKPVHLAHTDNS